MDHREPCSGAEAAREGPSSRAQGSLSPLLPRDTLRRSPTRCSAGSCAVPSAWPHGEAPAQEQRRKARPTPQSPSHPSASKVTRKSESTGGNADGELSEEALTHLLPSV